MVHAVDEQIGRIVAALEKRGMTENTLIILSSDNGGPVNLGATNGRLRAGKGSLYEGGVRSPALLTWPGKLKAGVNNEPLHIVDLYPTLVKLGGGSLEQKLPLDGKDIWPVLTQGKRSPHEDILFNVTPTKGALRMGEWKLVVGGNLQDPEENAPKKGKGKKKAKQADGDVVELFNLAADPSEKMNLAGNHPQRVRELRARLDAYARQAVPPKARPKAADFMSPKVWGE
jgi:arylsulfatase A-like enzyme